MTNPRIALVGDGIENPGNIRTLLHVAQMFGAECRFHGLSHLDATEASAGDPLPPLAEVTKEALAEQYARIIAFDNLPGASDVYGFRPGPEFAVLVGNERRGLSAGCRALATSTVQVPMVSRRINCLNVGASAAVALYYMCRAPGGCMALRRDPASRRPELLLMGATDHIELGSAIRSAVAFGWKRALVDDRAGVWFGVDRVTRSEGRAAARRARNEIRLQPCPADVRLDFPEVTVITRERVGRPIHRFDLARGSRQLVILPDHAAVDTAAFDWGRYGRDVEFAYVDLPHPETPYQFRLFATIALAEISRQVGRRKSVRPLRERRGLGYEFALELGPANVGEAVRLSDLLDY